MNVSRIQRKVGNGSVLMGTEYDTTFPDSLYPVESWIQHEAKKIFLFFIINVSN